MDEEGNRRWWVIKLNKQLRYEDIQAFPAEQLWAQIYSEVSRMDKNQKQSCFRLTHEERNMLNASNRHFEKKLRGQQEIEDILDGILAQYEPGEEIKYELINCSDFKQKYAGILRSYNAAMIGKALTKIGYEEKKSNGKRGRLIPIDKKYSPDHIVDF